MAVSAREIEASGAAARAAGSPGTGAPSRSAGFRKYGRYLFHLAVLAGLGVAGARYINGAQLWRAVHQFSWTHAPVILLLTVAYILLKGWRFTLQLRELTPASRRLVMRAYVAGQACTLLPGGVTVRAGLLDQAGVPVADSAAAIAVSSLSDQLVLLLCSLLSALWFEPARPPVMAILSGLALLSILLGIEASRTWLLELVERLLGKVHLLEQWRRFLDSLVEMSSWTVWTRAVANAAGAFVLMVLALHFAVEGVGAQIPYSTLVLAFTLPSMLGRISAMPGGVGVTEAGMIGILDTTPGVTLDQAAAATVIFRVGTVLFAALLGGLVYLFGWRGTAEASR